MQGVSINRLAVPHPLGATLWIRVGALSFAGQRKRLRLEFSDASGSYYLFQQTEKETNRVLLCLVLVHGTQALPKLAPGFKIILRNADNAHESLVKSVRLKV